MTFYFYIPQHRVEVSTYWAPAPDVIIACESFESFCGFKRIIEDDGLRTVCKFIAVFENSDDAMLAKLMV